MADEFVDILDKTGKLTGEVKLKSEAHRLGLYHASVHIWFYTKNGEVLLQKRAYNKDTYPNLWDVSVAGHIEAGETPENTAIRETKEEIGLSISKMNLDFMGIYLSKKTPKPNLYDNEFHHIYLSHLEVPITSLLLQEEEVSDIALIHYNVLKEHLQDSKQSKTYVPHNDAYYNLILNKIINRLQ